MSIDRKQLLEDYLQAKQAAKKAQEKGAPLEIVAGFQRAAMHADIALKLDEHRK